MIVLCSVCSHRMNYIPSWVDGHEIDSSIEMCRCRGTHAIEYTENEIEELKEYYSDGREELDQMNERERVLFKYLGGISGEISFGESASGLEDREPDAGLED